MQRDRLTSHTGTALGAGAAAAAWVCVLIVLNVTTQPVVSAAAFAGLAVLCVYTPGGRRLLLLAVLIGAGMCVAVPGIGFADGSLRLAFAHGTWVRPAGAWQWLAAGATTLRVPAQVMAIALLARVPSSLLLAGVARFSSRGALMAGLAARMGPLLRRDARLVREELLSRGVALDRSVSLGARLRGAGMLWDALVTGMFDRALVTAAALRTRGYGASPRVTIAPLREPRLRSGAWPMASVDGVVTVLAAASLGVALIGRASGALAAPTYSIFGGATEHTNAAAVFLAALITSIGIVPVIARGARSGHQRTSAASAAPEHGAEHRSDLVLDRVTVTHLGAVQPTVRDVSLRVAAGELVVVIGASGSGKSTLLDAITGVAPGVTGGERSGTIRLGNVVLRGDADSVGSVAAVFQVPEAQVVVGHVAEEVAFGMRQAGTGVDEIEQRVLAALETMRVAHLAQRDCATLSGGELQRVLLAAALAMSPDLLVLDEPTSQLDAASARAFWQSIDEARRASGMGVLVAEHRLQHVLLRADRVYGMVDGGVEEVPRESVVHDTTWDGMHPPRTTFGHVRLEVQLDRLLVGDGASTVQRDLRFAVRAGSIVTVEGRNGTGKSTLLRAIRGVEASSGFVRIDGHERGSVVSSVHQVGWMSQGIGAYLPGASVREAVRAVADRIGVGHERALASAAAAGFAERLDAHPATLSVGERQRLAFVASTSHGAPIWLLDEPTRGMDAGARQWLASHLYEHARLGGVVVIATHDPAFAAAVATHRLLLDARTAPHVVDVIRDASGRPIHDVAIDAALDDMPEVIS